MSRKEHHTRSFEKIFEQATIVGAENVILNDSEVGIIQAGGGPPLSAGTIQNCRWKGFFNAPYQHGVRVALNIGDPMSWLNAITD